MNAQILKLNAQIAKLAKRRAEVLARERKAKKRALLRAAEQHGLLSLELSRLEALFASLRHAAPAAENAPQRKRKDKGETDAH